MKILWVKPQDQYYLHGAVISSLGRDQMRVFSQFIREVMPEDTFERDRRMKERREKGRDERSTTDRRFSKRLLNLSANKENGRRVVITGLGAISPAGIGAKRLLKLMKEGVSEIKRIPALAEAGFPTYFGGRISDADIDPLLIPRQLPALGTASIPRNRLFFSRNDRSVQLALLASIDALMDSGLDLSLINRRAMGLSVGTTLGGLEFAFRAHEAILSKGLPGVDPCTVAAATPSSSSGEIAAELKIRGPSSTFSQGCTSGMSAIQYSYDLIKSGRAQVMIAGGSDCPFNPTIFASFCRANMLAKSINGTSGNHSPFDSGRDGMILGEGSGILILEDLQHAKARGAKIYAEIAGIGNTCDGYDMVRWRWHGSEASRAMKLALEEGRIPKEQVSLIFAHATGSIEGDEMELNALSRLFGRKINEVPISNLKASIGYSQGACGPFEVIGASLAIQEQMIPPVAKFRQSSPRLNISTKCRISKIENILVNCFGFGGKNLSLVLRKYA